MWVLMSSCQKHPVTSSDGVLHSSAEVAEVLLYNSL